MFSYRSQLAATYRVEVAFTDHSTSLHAEAAMGGDSFELRKARLVQQLGKPIIEMNQVHGTAVHLLAEHPTEEPVPTCDALVSTASGLALMVRVADCVPILLADPHTGVVAAVHAGREGMLAGVVEETLAALHKLGAEEELVAWIGPHVCGDCYEVPAQMQATFVARYPVAEATSSQGTPALDLGATAQWVLTQAGVTVRQVNGCTIEDPQWHSYRRDGSSAGRFAGLIWMEGP